MDPTDLLAKTLSPCLSLSSTRQVPIPVRMQHESLKALQGRIIQSTCSCSPLFSRDAARQQEYSTSWLSLPSDTKEKIKQGALETLVSASHKSGNDASTIVAAIAVFKLPQGQWHSFLSVWCALWGCTGVVYGAGALWFDHRGHETLQAVEFWST
ncbi:hypothetical protein H0H92_007150, partial [Tricholoma furcatifolium]